MRAFGQYSNQFFKIIQYINHSRSKNYNRNFYFMDKEINLNIASQMKRSYFVKRKWFSGNILLEKEVFLRRSNTWCKSIDGGNRSFHTWWNKWPIS